MKLTSVYILIFLFSIQILSGQGYLIDSSSTLTIFGSNLSSITNKKYSYDDQFRIIKTETEFQLVEYTYSNQYDFVKTTVNPQTNLYSPRQKNYYNTDGLISILEREQIDQSTQIYTLDTRRTYEYDQENRLLSELQFSYTDTGEEYLTNSFDYNYVDGKLMQKIDIFYVLNAEYRIITTDFEYINDKLISENQVTINNGTETSYVKTYAYFPDDKLKSYHTTFFANFDTSFIHHTDVEYTDHGVHEFTSLFSFYEQVYFQNNEFYHSYVESPFYEKDSFINRIFTDSIETGIERRFNSEVYSENGDSAFVRREVRIDDSQFSSFIGIGKDLYKRYDGLAAGNQEEDIQVATIFPNPIKSGSTAILQKMIKTVDRVDIYNSIGQKQTTVDLTGELQKLIIAPEIAGLYYLVYFEKNRRIGKIGKLIVE